MSLFTNTSGRIGEDIATEVLSYMLSSPTTHVPFQKLFFYRILQKAVSSTELQAEATTQPSFEVGRPDLIILTSDTLIIIETKLGAYLSGDDQLIKYCEIFQDCETLRRYFPFLQSEMITRKVMVLLAPCRTIELSVAATNRLISEDSYTDFHQWCTQREIDFVSLPWEKLLTDLNKSDSLENELILFVDKFTNQELSEEEILILKNSNIPDALNKIFNTITDVRDFLFSEGIKTGRIGQSYNYYGFTIEFPGFECWFGYFLQIWGKYETPVFLQVRQEWIKANEAEILNTLQDMNFQQEDEHEFILPFPVDSIDTWKKDLLDLLAKASGNREANA